MTEKRSYAYTDEFDRGEGDESNAASIEYAKRLDELLPLILLELKAHSFFLSHSNTVQTPGDQGKQLYWIALQLLGCVLGLPVLPLEGDRSEEKVVSQAALHLAIHSEVEDTGPRPPGYLTLNGDLAGPAE